MADTSTPQSLYNNIIDTDIIDRILIGKKNTLYKSIYLAQKSLSGLDVIHLDINSLINRNGLYYYNLPKDFIEVSARLFYRRSKFYKEHVSYDDIISNPDIFLNLVLLIINGRLCTDFYIKFTEDITSLIIDTTSYDSTFTTEEFENMIDNDLKISIIVCPQLSESNKNDYLISDIKSINNLSKNPGLKMDNFTYSNSIARSGKLWSFLSYDDNKPKLYKMVDNNKIVNRVILDNDQLNEFTNTKSNVKFLFYPHSYLKTIIIDKDKKYFELDIMDMPIPKTNILLFRKSGNDILFDHDSTLSIYYPNIYQIDKNHNDDIIAIIFYWDDTEVVGMKYVNELKQFYDITDNILDKYEKNNIPNTIKKYEPLDYEYSIDDFNKSDQYPNYLDYKIKKIEEIFKKDPDLFKEYLDYLISNSNNNGDTTYIDGSKIDLDNRLRNDNHSEITDKNLQEEFDEPHYLFTVKNNDYDNVDIFVDNYHVNPKTYFNGDYIYIYIPVTKVNAESMLEINKYNNVFFKKEISPAYSGQYIFAEISKNVNINDIYVSKYMNGNEYYVDSNLYDFYAKYKDEYVLINKSSFSHIDRIYVKISDELFDEINNNGKDNKIYLNTTNKFYMETNNKNNMEINKIINPDKEYFAIYKDGRFISHLSTEVLNNEEINGPHTLQTTVGIENTNTMDFVSMPIRQRFVYKSDFIDKSGLVDLVGKIDKPIDLKWYNIYVNGLKLHHKNIEIISPYKMIVKGIPTRSLLIIYQKYLDETPFNISDSKDIVDKIIDEIPSIKDAIMKDVPELEDNLPLIENITEAIINDFIKNYINTIGLINPDLQQIDSEIKENYSILLDANNVLFIQPDNYLTIKNYIQLNPDKINKE